MSFKSTNHFYNHVIASIEEDARWQMDEHFGPMTSFGRGVAIAHDCGGSVEEFTEHMVAALAAEIAEARCRRYQPERSVRRLARLFKVTEAHIETAHLDPDWGIGFVPSKPTRSKRETAKV